MIEIKNLSLRLGSFSLKDVNLTVNNREYLIILGPTGAGKTILLECIAGLHKIKRGEIWINEKNVTNLTPEDRHVGYIPQDYVLFPFLNVKDNIAFGLRRTNPYKTKAQERIKNLAHILGISHLMDRDTHSLSGGEKQRVSIARALAPSADILLLDEPFSSLDQQTSKHLRLELHRIHKQLGITTIHVTHNQIEAEEMGDRIAVLNYGKLEQVDVPHEIFFAPKSEMVSNFIGGLNILDCETCQSIGPALVEVKCGNMHIILPHDEGLVQKIAISPRDVYVSDIAPPGPSINRFKGIIIGIKQTGVIVELEIKVGENTIRSETTADLFANMGLSVGSMVFIILKLRRLKIMNRKESV